MSDQYRTSVQKSNFDGKYDASSVMVTIAVGIAIWSSLEMIPLILTFFKEWKGLYFWSLSLCNLGVLTYAVGFMMVYFDISGLWFAKTLNDTGWVGMVVCQSLVLCSRLGLIVFDSRVTTFVKWMIIVNSTILVPFPIIFDFGTTYSDLNVWPRGYFYIEHVQVTVFNTQECIISALYVVRTIALLNVITKAKSKAVVWQLLIFNVIVIPMDAAVITMQFLKLQLFQEGIKLFVYAVKVKFELYLLTKLVEFIRENASQRTMTLDDISSESTGEQSEINMKRRMSAALESSETGKVTDVNHVEHVKTHTRLFNIVPGRRRRVRALAPP